MWLNTEMITHMFSIVFYRSSWIPLHSISHTFLQKKKGKKRKQSCLVEGFKKASFLDKILPNWGVFSGQFLVFRKEVNWKMRVEILSGTEGLNLLFWIPGANLWLLFYPFFCKNVYPKCSYENGYRDYSIRTGKQGCGFLFLGGWPRLRSVWQCGFVKMRKKKNTLLW